MANFEINKSVQVGDTSNADLIRTTNILRDIGKNPIVTTEFSVDQDGILCGVDESIQLLQHITQNPNTTARVVKLRRQARTETDRASDVC